MSHLPNVAAAGNSVSDRRVPRMDSGSQSGATVGNVGVKATAISISVSEYLRLLVESRGGKVHFETRVQDIAAVFAVSFGASGIVSITISDLKLASAIDAAGMLRHKIEAAQNKAMVSGFAGPLPYWRDRSFLERGNIALLNVSGLRNQPAGEQG